MTQIQIIITDAQLQGRLEEFVAKASDLTPALADIGEYLLRKTRKRFDTQTAPDGTRWQSLAASTIRAKTRRKRTGKPYRTNAVPTAILKDTFTLRDSITYQISGKRNLAVGTNIAYGIFHQSEQPRTKIPARRFLGLDDADRAEVVEVIRDYLS